MKYIKLAGLAIAGILLSWSCGKDFIAKDIKNDVVRVLAPANNLITTSNQITFWWEEVNGADKYNIQIVKPDFATINTIIADTNVAGTKFTKTLTPGKYQWRIRAFNAGSNTPYTLFDLTIDTTSNLTNQLVSPVAPLANAITGNRKVVFKWNPLNAALQYQVVLTDAANGVLKDTTTTATSYTYTFPQATATYKWKVRALNNSSLTQYNTPLTFSIDVTPPSAPTLSVPLTGYSVSATYTLSWSRTGGADVRYDSVFIATDTLFTNVISRTKTYATSIPINALNNPPQVTNVVYWWRVCSVDSVGNRSPYTAPHRKFILTP